MSSVIEAYRAAFQSAAATPDFVAQQTTGLSFGQWSQWFPLTVGRGKSSVLAAYCKFSYTVSGTTITPVTGADVLDVVVQGVQVAAEAGGSIRSDAITRKGMEDVEQAAFDTNYGYPRAAPSSTAGTYTAFVYVPIGGPAAAIRFMMASATAGYSAGTVVLNSVTVYKVIGDNDTVVVFHEQNTPQVGTSTQDMHAYLSPKIAPSLIVLVTDTSSNVQFVNLAGQKGNLLITAADIDAVSNGAIAYTPRTGALAQGVALAADESVPSVFQVSFGTASTHDLLEIQFGGSQVTNPPTKPETTPSEPATKTVGVPNAANVPVAAKGGSYRTRTPRF